MQQTDSKVIIKEQKLVRKLLNLNEITQIEFNDRGWTSRVYMINSGEIVFKFPREEKVKIEYALEISAYKTAHEVRGDVLIPEVQWEHSNMDYIGYRGIIGEPMYKAIKTMSLTEKQKIGHRIGVFLDKFHRCDIKNAPVMTHDKEIDEHKEKLGIGLSDIEKCFTEAEVVLIKRFVLEEYPEKMRKLGFNKGLCHGDLGYWNMVHGSDGQIGIIDFGDVGYYDKSKDFVGMNDIDILDAALEVYRDYVSREKIELRMKIIPILDLPFFVGKKDQNGIEKTIERIRNVLLD